VTPATDPYRILGLTRGATLDEIRRAYRQLAKVNHPDAAGQQALPRFLAIQAAYEQLVGAGPSKAVPRPPSRPSSTDPDRADATHRAYGGRTRRTRPSGAGTGSTPGGTGSAGRARPSGSAGAPGGSGSSTGAGAGGASGPGGAKAKGKATLGSTSYDGADAGQFEPDWGGASWYGTTSGTYWTINPKEYADPRKHGPEYQARARRAVAGRAAASTSSGDADATVAMGDTGADPGDPTRPEDVGPKDASGVPPDPSPEHATSSWWRATAGTGETTDPAPPRGTPRPASAASGEPGPAAATAPPSPQPPDLGAAAADLGRALTDEHAARGWWRVVQAFVGWLPLALGIGWLIGELTGCSRFAASCDGSTGYLQPIVAFALLGVLLLVPSVAAIAAAGAVAVAMAAVPTALILSATGEAADAGSRATVLGLVIVAAWVVGVAIAIIRRVRSMTTPAGPVS
jgi:DnaJ domain